MRKGDKLLEYVTYKRGCNSFDTLYSRAMWIHLAVCAQCIYISMSQWLPCPLAIWVDILDDNLVKSSYHK